MAKVLCVLYDDPVGGYPGSYARDEIPQIGSYPGGQITPATQAMSGSPSLRPGITRGARCRTMA